MAITRFSFQNPTKYQGLEDSLPSELAPFAYELIRRLSENSDGLINAIHQQVPIDTSILPAVVSGESSTTATFISTSGDVEEAEILTILWDA